LPASDRHLAERIEPTVAPTVQAQLTQAQLTQAQRDLDYQRELAPSVIKGQVKPSATAEITCAQRAAETLRAGGRGLIDDPFAKYFLRSRAVKLRCANAPIAKITLSVFDRLYPGFMAIVLLRNRWYEDLLAQAVRDGVAQIVLLGAGYDTTALRLDLGAATRFEVDAPPTQSAKREVIETRRLTVPANVRYVPCDFERDSLPERLVAEGFDPDQPSLVVWFGVSFFLSEAAVRRTLTDVAQLAAPGSRFVWDYLDARVVDGTTEFRGAARARSAVAKRKEPYTFGLSREDAPTFFESFGFEVEENSSMTDLARRYGGDDGIWCSTDDFFSCLAGVRATRRAA
jgi:methyltransferase (TIGR00027 family)